MEAGGVDRIALRGIRIAARHGADAGEREREQTFALDVTAELDLTAAAASDDVAHTVHYGDLYRRIRDAVTSRSHALLERVAADVLDVIFEDPRVRRASVTVGKPGLLEGATPEVTLVRER
jgi:dihydroneopterin aldolase